MAISNPTSVLAQQAAMNNQIGSGMIGSNQILPSHTSYTSTYSEPYPQVWCAICNGSTGNGTLGIRGSNVPEVRIAAAVHGWQIINENVILCPPCTAAIRDRLAQEDEEVATD